jgi:DNA-binding MarR family transcriptional regulator
MDQQKELFLNNFHKVIGQMMRHSMRGFWHYTREQGLSMAQMGALRHIFYKQPCNVSNISDELKVTNAASSQLIDRLVQQGLITRFENRQDRRNKQVMLTEQGERVLHDFTHGRQSWLIELADRFSPEEMVKVNEALTIIEDKLSQLGAA